MKKLLAAANAVAALAATVPAASAAVASASVTPNCGQTGSQITVTVSGGAANSTGLLGLQLTGPNGGTQVSLGSPVSDSTGSYTLTATLPVMFVGQPLAAGQWLFIGFIPVSNLYLTVPCPADALLANLSSQIDQLSLPQGISQSLQAKIDAAVSSARADNLPSACGQLAGLANEVAAQSGKTLTSQQAADLINRIDAIRANLKC